MNEVVMHETMLRRHNELLARRKADEAEAAKPAASFAAALPPAASATPAPAATATATARATASADTSKIPTLSTQQMALLAQTMGAETPTEPMPSAAAATTPSTLATSAGRDAGKIPTLSSQQMTMLTESMTVAGPTDPAAPATAPSDQLSKAMAASRAVELPHDQVALLKASLGLNAPSAAQPFLPGKATPPTGTPALSDDQLSRLVNRFGKPDAAAQTATEAAAAPAMATPAPAPAPATPPAAAPSGELRYFPIQPGRASPSSASQAYLKTVHTMQRSLTAPGFANGR